MKKQTLWLFDSNRGIEHIDVGDADKAKTKTENAITLWQDGKAVSLDQLVNAIEVCSVIVVDISEFRFDDAPRYRELKELAVKSKKHRVVTADQLDASTIEACCLLQASQLITRDQDPENYDQRLDGAIATFKNGGIA